MNLDRSSDSFTIINPPPGYRLVPEVSGTVDSDESDESDESYIIESLFFAHESNPDLAVNVTVHRTNNSEQGWGTAFGSEPAAIGQEFPDARLVSSEPGSGLGPSLVLRADETTWIWIVPQSNDVDPVTLTAFLDQMAAT